MKDVAHCIAVFVTLLQVSEFNYDITLKRGESYELLSSPQKP